ncbi:MAG: ABC-2 family transporter protein [Lachnospiraceae bacterium]|nr:ABC-2 family transporter protein [Lachnospiraceae bacterium]
MKKYYCFFKLRFATGLQYRMASVTALTTQLIWGLMECLAYKAIAEASGDNLPMNYSSIVTYIWLKEAFLVLVNTWASDNDLFAMIANGNISYELCRPVSIYSMWFSRVFGARIAEALMRCIPVLLCAFLMPEPYKMTLPVNGVSFLLFLVTLFLALGITVTFIMLVFMLCFFTISPQGWRMVLTGAVDFLSGNIIPLPFFPKKYLFFVEISPFAYMQNVPFRIYSGDLAGGEIYQCILRQIFWLVTLMILGVVLWKQAEKRVVVQGG